MSRLCWVTGSGEPQITKSFKNSREFSGWRTSVCSTCNNVLLHDCIYSGSPSSLCRYSPNTHSKNTGNFTGEAKHHDMKQHRKNATLFMSVVILHQMISSVPLFWNPYLRRVIGRVGHLDQSHAYDVIIIPSESFGETHSLTEYITFPKYKINDCNFKEICHFVR